MFSETELLTTFWNASSHRIVPVVLLVDSSLRSMKLAEAESLTPVSCIKRVRRQLLLVFLVLLVLLALPLPLLLI